MDAEHGLLIDEAVQCPIDIFLNSAARLVGGGYLAFQPGNALLSDRLVGDRERLGEDKFMGKLQQAIEHSRPGEGGYSLIESMAP